MNICLAIHGTSQPEFSSISGVGNNKNGVLQERKTGLTNEKSDDHIHATFNLSKTEYHLVGQNASLKADAETQWTPSSAEEAAKALRRSEGLILLNYHDSQGGEKENDLKDHSSKTNCPPKKLSLLDLISDSSNGSSRKRSPLELHAAFAAEGWEDDNQQMGMFPDKFSIYDVPTTIESIEDDLYSLNMGGVNESPIVFCYDGSCPMNHSFPDCFSAPIDANVISDNHLRTSHIVNARDVIEDVAKVFNEDDLERNCQVVLNGPSTTAKFVSCKIKNDVGINTINLDASEIYSCRTLSPASPNFHQQRLRKMQEAFHLEEFEICSSKATSGDSQTSPYLEELSAMQEKSDLYGCKSSRMESTSQINMQANIDSLTAQLFNKTTPVFRRSFDATSEPKFTTTSVSLPKSKLNVSGDLESVDESMSSPISYFEGEERIKYLAISQKFTLQNNSIDEQGSKAKLNRFHNNNNEDQVSRSMDQLKVVLHEHIDAQRSRTQRDKQISVDLPEHKTSLKIESSLTPRNNQEDTQFAEPQNNRNDVHHMEAQTKECSSSSYAERQEPPISDENKEPITSPGKHLSIKPERTPDSEGKGCSTRDNLCKPSLTDLSEANREKFESQENKGKEDNTIDWEYQGMLESYILQLRCMYRALQETPDRELCSKCNNIQ